jgi:3-hydroxyisobutyrate dehydrogenase-like beta-hydroxyacid dehydrogenase
VFENAPTSSLIIDCSTIDPGTSTALNGEAAAAGHRMIDAPVCT